MRVSSVAMLSFADATWIADASVFFGVILVFNPHSAPKKCRERLSLENSVYRCDACVRKIEVKWVMVSVVMCCCSAQNSCHLCATRGRYYLSFRALSNG